jgi:hypothetical protein
MTLKQPVAGRFPNRDLAELSELAEASRFSEHGGDARMGRRLAIRIAPKAQAGGRMRILVVVHVYGRRKVDWSGCILALRKEKSEKRPLAFAFLHPHGVAVFKGLPFGSYRLALQPYGQAIWTDALSLPTPEQIEQQGWIEPGLVCGAIAERAAKGCDPETEGAEAVALLGALARRSEALAGPALGACLGLLCNCALPPELRSSASKSIIKKNNAFLSSIDLSRFFPNLRRPPKTFQEAEESEAIERKIYKAFGVVLSGRPMIGAEEKRLLEVLVARSQMEAAPPRVLARHTSSGVRTRGAVGPPINKKLLLTLALNGGSSVCDALTDILKALPGSGSVLASLRKRTP